jgi:hypothetical protein
MVGTRQNTPRQLIVCIDKGLAIKKHEMLEELTVGVGKGVDLFIMPTNGGKLASPLDNAMWADVKRRVRARKPKSAEEVGKVFEQEFYKTSKEKLMGWYKKAGILPRSDVKRDL